MYRLLTGLFTLLTLALLAVAFPGCASTTAAASVTSAVETSLTVLKTARSVICTTKLDPLLGDPREGQPIYTPQPRDAGVPTPPPVAPSAPAAPSTTPAPTVAPSPSPPTTPTGPAKGSGRRS